MESIPKKSACLLLHQRKKRHQCLIYLQIGSTTIERVVLTASMAGSRGSFHSDEALLKFFFLVLNNRKKTWTMPLRDWKAALNLSTIQFKGRMTEDWPSPVYTKLCTPSELYDFYAAVKVVQQYTL